jgi:hypothetical protein
MKRTGFPAMVVVGAIMLAACGGGDGSSTGSAAGGAGDTGGASEVASGPAGAFDVAECAQAVSAWAAAAAAVPAAASGSAADLQTSLDQLQAFAAAAPEAIRDDLMLVYQAYGEFVKAMQDTGFDPTSGEVPSAETIAAMEAASQKLDDPELTAASDRVSAWFAANCGG